jgi:hypothetical protein
MTQSPPSPKFLPAHSNTTYIADLESKLADLEGHRRERMRKTTGCAVVWAVAVISGFASGAQVEGERGYAALTLFVYLL